MMREMLRQRLQILRAKLSDWGIDAILIGSAANRRWLTGFTGSAGWVLVSQDEAILATDFRYWEQAQLEAPWFELFKLRRTPGELETFISDHARPIIGIEGKHLSLDEFRRFRKIEQVDIRWKPISDQLEALRDVKSAAEIFVIRQAAAITDLAMSQVNQIARPGMSEKELAWRLERTMREAGADELAFPIIVAAGRNAAKPHHHPSDQPAQSRRQHRGRHGRRRRRLPQRPDPHLLPGC